MITNQVLLIGRYIITGNFQNAVCRDNTLKGFMYITSLIVIDGGLGNSQ